uniref:Transcription elongation factor Spt5 n=1 Tax=Fervidicoccus fontis TaxID=683846 RepID=A0A7J3ZJN6_9CREN
MLVVEGEGSERREGIEEVERPRPRYYAVKITKGQEYTVALLVENRARSKNIPLYSIVASLRPRGFLILETPRATAVDLLIRDMRHVKGKVRGVISQQDVETMIKPKPMVEILSPGTEVEVVSGPLRGTMGKVLQVDRERNEVVLLVYEATYPLKVTVPGEHVKPVSREQG